MTIGIILGLVLFVIWIAGVWVLLAGDAELPFTTNAISRTIVLVIAAIVTFLGARYLHTGLVWWSEYNDSKSWQTTDATILESSIVPVKTRGSRPRYEFLVHYGYNIDGQDYLGDRYSFEIDNKRYMRIGESDQQRIVELVKQYPLNSRASAYYNPQKPSRSVLVREGMEAIRKRLIMGLIPTVAGMLLLIPATADMFRDH